MTIDRVTYQKIFPTGMAYLNHKIGVEVELSPGDNPDEAFQLAKSTVEKWNAESNPGIAATMEYMGNGGQPMKFNEIKDDHIDKEFEDLKAKLVEIEFYEDAKEYLDSTVFKHTMEAKLIINSKKRKV